MSKRPAKNVQVKIQDLDLSKISFKMVNGSGFINILYDNLPLLLRFGDNKNTFKAPFGTTENVSEKYPVTYSMSLTIPKDSEAFNKLKGLEELIIEYIVKKGKTIFNDDDFNMRDAKKMMTPLLKFSYEKDTTIVKKNSNGEEYDPTIKCKCTPSKKDPTRFICKFFDQNTKEVDALVDDTFNEVIPGMSDVKVLVRLNIWYTKVWGISATLEQAKFFPRESNQGYALADSDDEDLVPETSIVPETSVVPETEVEAESEVTNEVEDSESEQNSEQDSDQESEEEQKPPTPPPEKPKRKVKGGPVDKNPKKSLMEALSA